MARQARRAGRRRSRTRRSRNRPTRSCGSPRPGSAARTCTSTRRSARSWTTATSSATSRWASSRRSASAVTDLAVGDRVVMPFQISCGHCFMCDQRPATPSARRPRSAKRAWARRCSASPSSTAQCPAARRSSCASRRRRTRTIKVPDGPPDERFVLPLRRAADRLAGRRVRRDPRRRHAWWSSASARSATWRAGSPTTAGIA